MDRDEVVAVNIPVAPGEPPLLLIVTRRDLEDLTDHVFGEYPPKAEHLPNYTGVYETNVWLEINPFEGVGEHDPGEMLKLHAANVTELLRILPFFQVHADFVTLGCTPEFTGGILKAIQERIVRCQA